MGVPTIKVSFKYLGRLLLLNWLNWLKLLNWFNWLKLLNWFNWLKLLNWLALLNWFVFFIAETPKSPILIALLSVINKFAGFISLWIKLFLWI